MIKSLIEDTPLYKIFHYEGFDEEGVYRNYYTVLRDNKTKKYNNLDQAKSRALRPQRTQQINKNREFR